MYICKALEVKPVMVTVYGLCSPVFQTYTHSYNSLRQRLSGRLCLLEDCVPWSCFTVVCQFVHIFPFFFLLEAGLFIHTKQNFTQAQFLSSVCQMCLILLVKEFAVFPIKQIKTLLTSSKIKHLPLVFFYSAQNDDKARNLKILIIQ